MKSSPLGELNTKLAPVASATDAALLPLDRQRKIEYFNVFNVADLLVDYRNRPPMTFDRRAFYKISLI